MEELMLLAEEMEDEEEADAIAESFRDLQNRLETLKLDTLLSGKYDRNNAIISVHAGTGGVDAMDWAQMLYRMYTRWAEKKGYKVTLVDMQDDTEAGIKSATMIIEGENAYGYLKNEKGVHRLVRISPFNSAGKRQTSFCSFRGYAGNRRRYDGGNRSGGPAYRYLQKQLGRRSACQQNRLGYPYYSSADPHCSHLPE